MSPTGGPLADLDPTRALPAAAYRDPAWLAAEKAGIWHGDWVFATMEDALPAAAQRRRTACGAPRAVTVM